MDHKPSSQDRVAVFGDLSGYLAPFEQGLARLGVDLEYLTMPSDLKIIQLGDLVHKGPDSDEIVSLVKNLIAFNPGQYFQLGGNHEAFHLGGPKMMNRDEATNPMCNCGAETVATIRDMYANGKMVLAAAVGEKLDTLVTHAGLSRPMWERLGSPTTALEAAFRINMLGAQNPVAAFSDGERPGQQWPAGVVWAHGAANVYQSWLGHEVPFDQIHGHVDIFRWVANTWGPGLEIELPGTNKLLTDPSVTTVDRSSRSTTTLIGGHKFFGIDPGFTRNPRSVSPEINPHMTSGVDIGIRFHAPPTPQTGASFRML